MLERFNTNVYGMDFKQGDLSENPPTWNQQCL